MNDVAGASTFHASGEAYDLFMGRYARELAKQFADFAQIFPGSTVLDVGCGPGALTGEAAGRIGVADVVAVDPSLPFVEACRTRHPGVEVRVGSAEALPSDDAMFDVAAAQLVWHFVTDSDLAVRELSRVVAPGGLVAVCVWDFDGGMELLRAFSDAALSIDSGAPDDSRTLRFGRPGEIAQVLTESGLLDVDETTLTVESHYADFDELWSGFLAGIGPAGAYLLTRSPEQRAVLREALFERVGSPAGPLTLSATARAARGRVPAR